jgi:hypothetical protein
MKKKAALNNHLQTRRLSTQTFLAGLFIFTLLTNATLSDFIISMRTGLAAFAVFSCLGVIISFGREKIKAKLI